MSSLACHENINCGQHKWNTIHSTIFNQTTVFCWYGVAFSALQPKPIDLK